MVETIESHEKRDNISLKRNAKGEYYWDIKVYFDGSDVGSSDGALHEIKTIDAKLKDLYL